MTAPEWPEPKLWDQHPGSVVHIAGGTLMVFGRYFRQRCDWCGYILVEGDLSRIAVRTEDLPYNPAFWPVGSQVRVDRHMSAEVETVFEEENGEQIARLPSDSCCFDPATQVGWEKDMQDFAWRIAN